MYNGISILSLHTLAPRTVHCVLNVIVPVLSDGALVADLAVDSVALHQRETGDDARFPSGPTVSAGKRAAVAFAATVLASSAGERLADSTVHVDFENPVSDVVSLLGADNVLLWKWNLEWRWDISVFEFGVVDSSSIIRVVDGVIKVDVSVEVDES